MQTRYKQHTILIKTGTKKVNPALAHLNIWPLEGLGAIARAGSEGFGGKKRACAERARADFGKGN